MAGGVRLFEHPDFEQAMLRAADHFEVSEQFVEKDYYVTEILRVIAARECKRTLFTVWGAKRHPYSGQAVKT